MAYASFDYLFSVEMPGLLRLELLVLNKVCTFAYKVSGLFALIAGLSRRFHISSPSRFLNHTLAGITVERYLVSNISQTPSSSTNTSPPVQTPTPPIRLTATSSKASLNFTGPKPTTSSSKCKTSRKPRSS